MMRNIAVLLILALSTPAFADEVDIALEKYGFVEKPVPTEYRSLGMNPRSFEVRENGSGQIVIEEKKEEFQNEPISISFNNRKYVGTDKGEFIGELTLTMPDGATRELLKGNVHFIIPSQKRSNWYTDDPPSKALLVFTGLSHLALSRGAVYSISSHDTDPFVELFTLLPECPELVIPDKRNPDSFLIVTSAGISTISTQFLNWLKVPATNLYWWGRYPNSVVQIAPEDWKSNGESRIIVGMREGVSVVDFFWDKVKAIKHYEKAI